MVWCGSTPDVAEIVAETATPEVVETPLGAPPVFDLETYRGDATDTTVWVCNCARWRSACSRVISFWTLWMCCSKESRTWAIWASSCLDSWFGVDIANTLEPAPNDKPPTLP